MAALIFMLDVDLLEPYFAVFLGLSLQRFKFKQVSYIVHLLYLLHQLGKRVHGFGALYQSLAAEFAIHKKSESRYSFRQISCKFDVLMLVRTKKKTMCITLAIDGDVFNIAKQKAQCEHLSIGTAVSELMRMGIGSMQMSVAQRPATQSKYAVLPARNEIITSEHVYKLMEQEVV